MPGFDMLYMNDYSDEEIIEIAGEQKRIILTRDKLLLRSPGVLQGINLVGSSFFASV
jgi:uncharacterized protein with PIN domain